MIQSGLWIIGELRVPVRVPVEVHCTAVLARAFFNKFLLGGQMTKRDPIAGEC